MIYLDNSATTQIYPVVLEAMKPYFDELYFNPSSQYESAVRCKQAIETAREQVAKLINAEPEEIYFTSGGSESNNWALKGLLLNPKFLSYGENYNRLITDRIEHHAILNTANFLNDCGVTVDYLDVDKDGFVDKDFLKQLLSYNSAYEVNLVSVMAANNEIGTIQNLKEVVDMCHSVVDEFGEPSPAIVHTDAVQAFGHMPIDVKYLGVDMLSASGHKIGAPKGVGILYISNRIKDDIIPLVHGGEQEIGMRAGTYNTPSIVGFGEACRVSNLLFAGKMCNKITSIRALMIDKLLTIPNSHINGSRYDRLPNNINIRFDGIKSEELLVILENRGILCSSGSACNSASGNPSHVLKAIGLTDEEANSSIRISLPIDMTIDQAEEVVSIIKKEVEILRKHN